MRSKRDKNSSEGLYPRISSNLLPSFGVRKTIVGTTIGVNALGKSSVSLSKKTGIKWV